VFGGVHFELTGEDVTECVGRGVTEADLGTNYASACDPRLNYRQSLEMALRITRRLRTKRWSARADRPLSGPRWPVGRSVLVPPAYLPPPIERGVFVAAAPEGASRFAT